MHQERMPSGLSSLIGGVQQFLCGDPAGTLTKLPDGGEGFVDLLLTPVDLGHDPRDAAPMARDNQCCSPLHFVQKLGKMNFGFRGLNFEHIINQSIRPVSLYHRFLRPEKESKHPCELIGKEGPSAGSQPTQPTYRAYIVRSAAAASE